MLKLFFKKLLSFTLAAFLLLTIAVSVGFFYLFSQITLGSTLDTRHIAQTTMIYDRTGQHVLYEMHDEENRKIISHDQIPKVIRVATIATEDDAFYTHPGIDIMSIARATKVNIESGSPQQGGSTITQQLARNAFLTREKTVRRKVLEIIYAIKIERKYTKDQILDAYLNEVPYGSNAYGIEAAAETYFGKKAQELTLDEAAMLAALTKAPSYYSPYGNHQEALISRQKKVLSRIAELNPKNKAAVEEALKIDTLQKVKPQKHTLLAPHFVFFVKEKLEEKYGETLVREGGLKVYTTLDYNKQKLAEQTINSLSEHNLKRYGASNAALVAIDPKTGQILAMVGSKDYYDDTISGKVNVAIRPRQPGSSFKPFEYAKAFEAGFEPDTLILDAPTDFGPDGSGRHYVPNNYSGRFHGMVTMRQALAMSLNVPAVKTLREVGIDQTIELAHRLGITTLNDRSRYGLALAIGGAEVTLLDETSSFSVFANDGKRNPADPILKIIDGKGDIIQQNYPPNSPVLNPQVARRINSVLSDNKARTPVFGPNNKLFIPGKTVAAKTGTTQEYKDAWTVGYTPDIAVGVWVGNSNNRAMRPGADGSFVAAPIWNKFMIEALKEYPDAGNAFAQYDGVEKESKLADSDKSQKKPGLKITYYKKGTNKKISEKKAKKMGLDKVTIKTEITDSEGDGTKTCLKEFNRKSAC